MLNKKMLIAITSVFPCLTSVILKRMIKIDILDFSKMNYTEAFENLHELIKKVYPFTSWKKLDLDKIYQGHIEKIENSQKSRSKKEFYLAMLGYIKSFSDGHMMFFNPMEFFLRDKGNKNPSEFYLREKEKYNSKLKKKYIGGSYGFTVIELDNGNVIASNVRNCSLAHKAGIKFGCRIIEWNNRPVTEAVEDVSLLWSDINPANKYHIKRMKYAFLARGPVDEQSLIKFLSEDGKEKTVIITAQEDNFELLNNDMEYFYQGSKEREITWKVIDGDHGFITLNHMDPGDLNYAKHLFATAVKELLSKNIKDLIIDVRNNHGGSDAFGADLLSYLTHEEIYYIQESKYDGDTKSFVKFDEIISKPQSLGFDKEIIILANNIVMSAGEGFVYNVKKLSNVKTAGFTGTHGSFGSVEGIVVLPQNIGVVFPTIACCDSKGRIIIDSDYTGTGGVQPDIKIPLDRNAVVELYEKKKDYELDYVLSYLSNKKSDIGLIHSNEV